MNTNIQALTIATATVIWLIVALTIGTELSASFKELLAKVGGHHWVGKSIVSTVFFLLVYLVFRKSGEPKSVLFNAGLILGSVVSSGVIIFLFFLSHFLKG